MITGIIYTLENQQITQEITLVKREISADYVKKDNTN